MSHLNKSLTALLFFLPSLLLATDQGPEFIDLKTDIYIHISKEKRLFYTKVKQANSKLWKAHALVVIMEDIRKEQPTITHQRGTMKNVLWIKPYANRNFDIWIDSSKEYGKYLIFRDRFICRTIPRKKLFFMAFNLMSKEKVIFKAISFKKEKVKQFFDRVNNLSDPRLKLAPKIFSSGFNISKGKIFLFQEYLPINLKKYIEQKKPFAKKETLISLIKKLIILLIKLKENNMVHFDFHERNILLRFNKQNQKNDYDLLLIDWDLAQKCFKQSRVSSYIINRLHSAPEVWHAWLKENLSPWWVDRQEEPFADLIFNNYWHTNRKIDFKSDVFSAGIIIYNILYSYQFSFLESLCHIAEIPKNLTRSHCRTLWISEFLTAYQKGLASEKNTWSIKDPLKALCAHMLIMNKEERISAKQALLYLEQMELISTPEINCCF